MTTKTLFTVIIDVVMEAEGNIRWRTLLELKIVRRDVQCGQALYARGGSIVSHNHKIKRSEQRGIVHHMQRRYGVPSVMHPVIQLFWSVTRKIRPLIENG